MKAETHLATWEDNIKEIVHNAAVHRSNGEQPSCPNTLQEKTCERVKKKNAHAVRINLLNHQVSESSSSVSVHFRY